MYLYWPHSFCKLHTLVNCFKASKFDFFNKNAEILSSVVEDWRAQAKEFLTKIWNVLDEDEIDLGDISITPCDSSVLDDIDPDLLSPGNSQTLAAAKIEGDYSYRKIL